MWKASELRFHEIKAVTNLVHECVDLGSDAFIWRNHLIRGLLGLLDADVAVIHDAMHLAPLSKKHPPQMLAFVEVGMDDVIRAAFSEFTTSLSPLDCSYEKAFSENLQTGHLLTARNSDFLTEEQWQADILYDFYMRRIGLANIVQTRYSQSADAPAYSIALNRSTGRRQFSERECNLLTYCFSQVVSLYGTRLETVGKSPLDGLRPRDRDVLYLVLCLFTEKKIASSLGISPHTVRDYSKRLNRSFNVQSREQLLVKTLKLLPILERDFQERNGWSVD